MQGKVAATWLYPIKGFAGIRTKTRGLLAHPYVGVAGDRNSAIYRGRGEAPTEWRPKGQFYVCMNTEGLATVHSLTEADLDEEWRLDQEQVWGVVRKRGLTDDQSKLLNTELRWHVADTNKACVSFLNLASVRALGVHMGVDIDPRRFRMNVWVEGLAPFVELNYVQGFEQGEQHPMLVGDDLRLGIDDLCERCKATEQNPQTGKWDIELREGLSDLLQKQGYQGSPHRGKFDVMGWYGIPSSCGMIREGHRVILGDAR